MPLGDISVQCENPKRTVNIISELYISSREAIDQLDHRSKKPDNDEIMFKCFICDRMKLRSERLSCTYFSTGSHIPLVYPPSTVFFLSFAS